MSSSTNDNTNLMSFTGKLRKMNEAVASGNFSLVRLYVESLSPRDLRPVVESSVCIGFNKGANYDILYWMANRVGTLKISRTTPNGPVRLSRA